MRRMFQDNWHGIAFKDFARLSSHQLAGPEFYEAFYRHFLMRYHGWADLDPFWVGLKLEVVKLLEERIAGQKNAKILSVSCGLGFMEKVLLERGYHCLDITESSEQSLVWIKEHVSRDRIFVGGFPDCLPQGRTYDIIYLSAAEYFLDQDELIHLLRDIRGVLSKDGRCVLISVSIELSDALSQGMLFVKDWGKLFLEVLKIRHRGQFWGYVRTRAELLQAMRAAGFSHSEDGMINEQGRHFSCWVEGRG